MKKWKKNVHSEGCLAIEHIQKENNRRKPIQKENNFKEYN